MSERPKRHRQSFRRKSVRDLFETAFALYRQNFFLFVGVLLVIYIPAHLIDALMTGFPVGKRDFYGQLVYMAVSLPLAIAHGAMIKVLFERILDRQVSLVSSYRYLFLLLIPYLLTNLLLELVVVLGFVLLIIPGIIALFWVFFVPYVAVVEKRFYRRAIERSRRLAEGEWGRILLITGFGVLLFWAPYQPTLWLANTLGAPLGEAALFRGLLVGLVRSLLAPLPVLLGGLLYLDVRARKEDLDPIRLAWEID
jgi:hypothetical protein